MSWPVIIVSVAAAWILFGLATLISIPEGDWAGIPQWRAILTWPLYFFGP